MNRSFRRRSAAAAIVTALGRRYLITGLTAGFSR
jgi:hypothetical protein